MAEPIRDKGQVRGLIDFYLRSGQLRNYVLIVMAVHTALRIGDILSLNVSDVYDFANSRVFASITVTERKTGKSKIVALDKAVVKALRRFFLCCPVSPGDALFRSRKTGRAIGRVQAYRIIRAAADALALPGRVGCTSLRKSFGYHSWKSGAHPVVIMEIYNHSSWAVTRRYLGVTQDDINGVYLGLSFAA
jgi:integrase